MNTQNAQATINKAKKLLTAGRPQEAESVLSKLIASVSVNADVFMLLAQAKRQLNQPEGIEQALLDALSVDPEHTEASINLANHFDPYQYFWTPS